MGDQPCSGDLRESLQTRHWEGASARWEAVGWGSFQGDPVEATPAESGLGVGVPVLDLPEIDMAAQFRILHRQTALKRTVNVSVHPENTTSRLVGPWARAGRLNVGVILL